MGFLAVIGLVGVAVFLFASASKAKERKPANPELPLPSDPTGVEVVARALALCPQNQGPLLAIAEQFGRDITDMGEEAAYVNLVCKVVAACPAIESELDMTQEGLTRLGNNPPATAIVLRALCLCDNDMAIANAANQYIADRDTIGEEAAKIKMTAAIVAACPAIASELETNIPPPNMPPPLPGGTSPGLPTGGNTPPPELQQDIDNYLKNIDNPLQLRFFADVLEARGFPEAAELLRSKARGIEAGINPFQSPGLPTSSP